MSTFDLTAKIPVETHVCTNKDCESEFAVLVIIRPSKEYQFENPEATGNYTDWATKSDYRPFCPTCGVQVLPPSIENPTCVDQVLPGFTQIPGVHVL